MNQGKIEVVKKEIARVNVDILGVSELKWIGMGEFNSDDHYIYYYANLNHLVAPVARDIKPKSSKRYTRLSETWSLSPSQPYFSVFIIALYVIVMGNFCQFPLALTSPNLANAIPFI